MSLNLKEFDGVYGPAWHCIVGINFGSFVTHSCLMQQEKAENLILCNYVKDIYLVHLAPGSKFNFQKYIKRSLEDDFKVCADFEVPSDDGKKKKAITSIGILTAALLLLLLVAGTRAWTTFDSEDSNFAQSSGDGSSGGIEMDDDVEEKYHGHGAQEMETITNNITQSLMSACNNVDI
ncbi:uncharacterized protein LOC133732275 [Rosa rugosa]|uniref:uncharacterized protein LOC133732275 n=1 Tax=Rosa rugosa TaxID=74645 RepID=UPI002B404174|nr:uncharacterized protein LOC133732275 [Rosa rugosa]